MTFGKMKNYLDIVLISFLCLAILPGCGVADETMPGEESIVFKGAFEDARTKVSLSPVESSLDLLARWESQDRISAFMSDGTEYQKFGMLLAENISADGKECEFTYHASSGIPMSSGETRLAFFSQVANPIPASGTVEYNACIRRLPIADFSAPVMYVGVYDKDNLCLYFRHYGTYEVLHITNDTNSQVTFSHRGFDADALWFYQEASLRLSDGSVHETSSRSMDRVENSPEMTIPAHETGMVVSWYIPNGKTIDKARLRALVNGKEVLSSNTKSSTVSLQTGRAYHMSASWNGTELKFSGGSELDAGGDGYGSDGSGNISGSGLGYGEDTSGPITGDGSGYGADGSGTLSGGGSGYSNGN